MLTQMNFLTKKVTKLEEQSTKKDKHFPLHKYENGKKQESRQNEEVLSLIQHKIEEQDKVLKEIKENIEMLNQTTTSNSIINQLQDAQINQLIRRFFLQSNKESPNDTMADSEEED
uniref:Uncharacterized protein n=1 Tax=Solanum tuberosum TaxID=4113 RepID=M1DGV2_SOLTU